MQEQKRLSRGALDQLSEAERDVYLSWRRTKAPPLPVDKGLKMFELYLNGYDCEAICKVNSETYPLGQILDARMRYHWDDRKEHQIKRLFDSIGQKILVTHKESLGFLSDWLAAVHKLYGDKVKQFIQDGDPEILPVQIRFSSIKDYKEMTNLLIALINATKKQVQVKGQVDHVHKIEQSVPEIPKEIPNVVESTPGELLKLLDIVKS